MNGQPPPNPTMPLRRRRNVTVRLLKIALLAAVLGTPAIFTSPLRTGFLLALEQKYHLLRNFDTMTEGLQLAEEWLARKDMKQQWQTRRQEVLNDSEDVTEFMYKMIQTAATARRDDS